MLLLSRKIGQQVVLPGCGVTIGVVRIVGNKVQLGIQAPPETSVHRQEIWDRISAQQGTRMASQPPGGTSGRPPSDGPASLAVTPENERKR